MQMQAWETHIALQEPKYLRTLSIYWATLGEVRKNISHPEYFLYLEVKEGEKVG